MVETTDILWDGGISHSVRVYDSTSYGTSTGRDHVDRCPRTDPAPADTDGRCIILSRYATVAGALISLMLY